MIRWQLVRAFERGARRNHIPNIELQRYICEVFHVMEDSNNNRAPPGRCRAIRSERFIRRTREMFFKLYFINPRSYSKTFPAHPVVQVVVCFFQPHERSRVAKEWAAYLSHALTHVHCLHIAARILFVC